MVAIDTLSTTFTALSDPTRRQMLMSLASGEKTVTELAEPFEISMPAITKHLRVLERAGLIERSRRAQWRPCRLKAEPLKAAAEWVDQYREFWEESFGRLDKLLTKMQKNKPKKRTKKRQT